MALALSDNFSLSQDWQTGKTLSESALCLMRAEKYADVWFCCKDQDKTVKEDRIAAHKLILACRSPVFEAMFYGELAETTNDISLPEIEKIPFLLFLRCVYKDTVELKEKYAIDVMRIAHQYEVTTCLEICSKFLRGILRPDNVCCILENALLLEDSALEKAAIEFIDDNAAAVIDTEGFRNVRRDTLEYILKGNTLFAPEAEIIKAADGWAVAHLLTKEMEITPANKRTAMGDAFYYLRYPTLSPRQFLTLQLTYEHLNVEDERKIARFIVEKGNTLHALSNSSHSRIPRKSSYFISFLECGVNEQTVMSTQVLENSISLTCVEDIDLYEIILSVNRSSSVTACCAIERSSDRQLVSVHEPIQFFPFSSLRFLPAIELNASDSPFNIKITLMAVAVKGHTKDKTHTPGQKNASRSTGFSFGSIATGFQAQNRTISTQTEPKLDSFHSNTSARLVYNALNSCFIRGIKYTNKSKR